MDEEPRARRTYLIKGSRLWRIMNDKDDAKRYGKEIAELNGRPVMVFERERSLLVAEYNP